MIELENKTAYITGASRGLGEGLASELVQRGVFVIGTSRSGPSDRVQEYIDNGRASYERADLALDRERVIQKIYEEHGGFEIFVNNAGALSTDFLIRLDPERIRHEIDLDLVLPILMHRQWLKLHSEREQSKTPQLSVNICSVSSFYAWPGGTVYQASKTGLAASVWAMRSTQQYLREEAEMGVKDELGKLANLNVRFLAIYPDSIDTGMISKAQQDSLYRIRGDLLPQEVVVDVIVKAIEGRDDWGRYDDIAILANPTDPRTGKGLKGIYVAFLPLDPETQRPSFDRRILKRIAGEEKLIRR